MATATALAVTTSAVPTVDLDEFIIKERKYLFKICMGFMKNPEDAEDMVQQISIKLYTKLHTFKGNAAFKTWATSIARNECLCSIRDRRVERRVMNTEVELTEDDLRIHAKGAVTPPVEYHDAKVEALWLKAINSLSPSYRKTLIAHLIEEKPYYEIAAELGVSLGAVKSYGGRGANLLNILIMTNPKYAALRSTQPLVPIKGRITGNNSGAVVHLVAHRKPYSITGTYRRNAKDKP